MALTRLRGRAVWSEPSLSAYARRHVFAWGGPFQKVFQVPLPISSLGGLGNGTCTRSEGPVSPGLVPHAEPNAKRMTRGPNIVYAKLPYMI